MKKRAILFSILILSFFSSWQICTNNAIGVLKHDPDAGLRLDIVREHLGNIAKMRPSDAKDFYEEALEELFALIKEYPGHEETLEAEFYVGATYFQMSNFTEAIKYFDDILSLENIERNFKARLLFFKAKSFLGLGDIEKTKIVVAELRVIEPGAANAFGRDLSGTLRLGMEAPNIITSDFNGNPVDLSQYIGDITVIVFWATWSEHCIQEFPKVKKLYRTFENLGVKFIGISQDDRIEDLRAFVQQHSIEWPQVFEGMRWKGTVSKTYNVEKIPAIFVLDRKGDLQYIGNDTKKVFRVLAKLTSLSK